MNTATRSRQFPRTVAIAVGVLLPLIALSCSSPTTEVAEDEAVDVAPTTTSAPTAAAAPTSPPTPAPAATATPVRPGPWEEVEGGPDCQCADGGDWSFFVREASPTKVVLFLDGGGACWTDLTCSPATGTYDTQVLVRDNPQFNPQGIFNFSGAFDNPFADWSFVVVPYCTGDVHLGSRVHEYADGDLPIAHVGLVNGRAAIDELLVRFPDAEQLLVTGSSAGGVAAPVYAGLLADALPEADIAVLADGSGAYPDVVPAEPIAERWGLAEGLGIDEQLFTVPSLFDWAAERHPQVRFARYDNEADEVQDFFISLTGMRLDGASTLSDHIAQTEALIEGEVGPVASWLEAGTEHTILTFDDLYELTGPDDTRLIDWLAAFVAGDPVPDIDNSN